MQSAINTMLGQAAQLKSLANIASKKIAQKQKIEAIQAKKEQQKQMRVPKNRKEWADAKKKWRRAK